MLSLTPELMSLDMWGKAMIRKRDLLFTVRVVEKSGIPINIVGCGGSIMIPTNQYPRPNFDTRFCIHGSPEQSSPLGWPGNARKYLEWCKNMGAGWIILLTDRDASSLTDKENPAGVAEVLDACYALDIMPVVRIYSKMGHDHGWMLDDTVKTAIRRLRAKGVVYIVTINEPELNVEWDGGRPDNWMDITANNMTDIALYIQSQGGIPILAAMATGSPDSTIDVVSEMLRVRGQDAAQVFNNKFVIGAHNYFGNNHPIGMAKYGESDRYPYDKVNWEGTPVTPEFYEGRGGYGSIAWGYDTLEMVNERRARDKNPGQTMLEDSCGEIALLTVAYRGKASLESQLAKDLGVNWIEGAYPLVASTEGGCTIGDRDDARYAKILGDYHADAFVEVLRRCMNTSTEKGGDLNYGPHVLFGGGWWLLFQQLGGSPNVTWESSALFTHWNDEWRTPGTDRLIAVDAGVAEPKVAYDSGNAPTPSAPEPPEPPEPPAPGPDLIWSVPTNLPHVQPVLAAPGPGETYWKLTRVRWLDKKAAQGAHHIVVDVIDENGDELPGIDIVCVNGGVVTAESYMDGGKPLNFPMYGALGSYKVFIADGMSDAVEGMGLGTPEQPTYTIHTAFELEFQRAVKDAEPEPPVPEPSDDIPPIVEMLPGVFVEDWRLIIEYSFAWYGSFDTREWPAAPDLVGLGFHWSGTKDGMDPGALETAGHFFAKGDPQPGYHYQVMQTGVIRWFVSPERIAWGIAGLNDLYLHVLAEPMADGRLTDAQVQACRKLWKAIEAGLGKELQIVGHGEVAATECPGPMWVENKARIIEEQLDDCEERLNVAKRIAAIAKEKQSQAMDLLIDSMQLLDDVAIT